MTVNQDEEDLGPQAIQDSRYEFPYHHLVDRAPGGGFHLHRYYHFGLDYWLNMDAVLEVLENESPDSLLDVGCGDGRLLKAVSDRSDLSDLVGIDLSERALDFAKAFNPDVDFYNSWERVPGLYDCVTAVEVLEHIKPDTLPSTVERIRSVITDSGAFVLTVPSERYETSDKHFQHFTRKKLVSLLEPHFSVEFLEFTVAPNVIFHILRRILVNRLWISNSDLVSSLVWRAAKRFCQEAHQKNGKHLLAVFRPE